MPGKKNGRLKKCKIENRMKREGLEVSDTLGDIRTTTDFIGECVEIPLYSHKNKETDNRAINLDFIVIFNPM